jgi:hypothetical protein
VGITISADDPRSIRAIEIAARASKWLTAMTPDGQPAFRVPSQTHIGRSYLVTRFTCDCPDFAHAHDEFDEEEDGDDDDNARACKHILAVRLYCELLRAQERIPRPVVDPRRAHLRLVR